MSDEYADKLDDIWFEYIDSNPQLFANGEAKIKDYTEMSNNLSNKLCSLLPKECEVCGYSYETVFGQETVDKYNLSICENAIVGSGLKRLFYRICPSCIHIPNRVLVDFLKKK